MDFNKAQSADNGFIVDEENGGPFYTGGTASPIGLDLPTLTFYLQSTAAGVLVWRKHGVGVNDWRQLSAQDIPFVDTGSTYKSATNTVAKAFEELRTTVISKPQIINTSLNGTFNIIKDTFSFIDVHGTFTGFSLELPDATLLAEGRAFDIVNNGDEIITIKDFDGNGLVTLNPDDLVHFILEHNTTQAGEWIFNITSSTATGILSSVVTSNTPFATSSPTDVLVTSFTVLPVAGRYLVLVSADLVITVNNRFSEIVVDIAGTVVANTRRTVQGVGNAFKANVGSVGEISVNGSQIVGLKVNISGGVVTYNQRSLILIRLGN
jgi:hypothetical protein